MDHLPLYWTFVQLKLMGMSQYLGSFWLITLSKSSLWIVEVSLLGYS